MENSKTYKANSELVFDRESNTILCFYRNCIIFILEVLEKTYLLVMMHRLTLLVTQVTAYKFWSSHIMIYVKNIYEFQVIFSCNGSVYSLDMSYNFIV